IDNFKSFGRKISIPFLQGYTSITGPNGSGKSNIADAILFVLGPKSSKAIRAGKLTDLIWNGGKDKNASDYCQVSLLFDNGDRQIPVEADEVKLTRYIGLSPSVEGGYNSYFYINDRKSSLSEFDSLLAHARISAEGYNLVQQGDVQKIVSMSSVDRRRILDNIAGITKFDDDITQAEGKRRETEENLERSRIILEEIDKQIKQLEADRDGALKYKDLNGRLTTAKAQLAYKNRELIERQIVGTKEQIGKHEADRAKLEAQKADLRTQLDAAVARLDELEREMAERGGEEAKQLKEKLDGLRIERARATDGTETSKETLKQIRAETADANKERAKVQKETEALARERGTLDTRVAELEGQIKTADGDLHEVDELASKSDAKVLGIQKQIIALNNEIDPVDDEGVRERPPEAPAGVPRPPDGGDEARPGPGRPADGHPQPDAAVRPAPGRGGRRGEHEARLHLRSVRHPRHPGDGVDQGNPRDRRAARPRRAAIRDRRRHGGGRPDAGDHRRRRFRRRDVHRLPQEAQDRPRDVPAAQQDARRQAARQSYPRRERVPRVRDRPVPLRRKVPRRLLLRLRRHARRPDARRGAEVDGRRPARDPRRRADRGLRRDDRRGHGALDAQVRRRNGERPREDRGEAPRGPDAGGGRREPPRRDPEGDPGPRGANQGLRRQDRSGRGEDEHPRSEAEGVRGESQVGGQGPRGPQGALRRREEDRDPDRRGPHEVHEGPGRAQGEAGRAQEGRHRGHAPTDLLADEGVDGPTRDPRGGVERPALEARGDGHADRVPRRAPGRTRHTPRRPRGQADGPRDADRDVPGVPRQARERDPGPREDGGPDGQEDQGPPGRARRSLQGEDGPRGGRRQGLAQDRDEGRFPPEDGDGAEAPGGAARGGGASDDGDGGRGRGGPPAEPPGAQGHDRRVRGGDHRPRADQLARPRRLRRAAGPGRRAERRGQAARRTARGAHQPRHPADGQEEGRAREGLRVA